MTLRLNLERLRPISSAAVYWTKLFGYGQD
jgi:hypothetical protein